ncbi:TrkH family potassium uptake protein [Methanoregula sp. PtaB.Bin085]|uniref:TrkH family potassium uptake protein n=1 Tax=Methanoregula sp. PtaB.Bin085 TaxID=1811680 RepID=UPI0009CD0D9F|nr:potassium transporter TrkG [Methanoregula sp. PtaB.Bin085]OPX64724.1 MAG: potassium transporter [Methanoregula sp. PtaB.Bin085]
MTRIEHIAMIAHDMGLIFEFLGIASLLPFLVLFVFWEWDLLLPMATAPLTFLLLGFFISHLPHRDVEPSFSITISAVALAWLAIAFIGALPFVYGHGMSFSDAVFEAMSGWTGTGFSMITSLDTTPKTLLFWRSLMHWVGGIGIIAFGMSLHRKTRLSLFRLYRAEGREEELVSATTSSGRRMWMIYTVLTLAFTGLIMLIGIPLWDSINLVMTAIATGGFTLHAGGLQYYNNPMLELLLIPVMLAGAVPFKIFFFLYHGRVGQMFRDRIFRVLLFIAVIGSLITSLDLYIFSNIAPAEAFRQGTFTAVSGLCTCGLQNSSPHTWAIIPLAIVSMMMFIGGSMGSAAGGVKVNRILMAYEGGKWWFRRFFVSSRVNVPLRFGGRTVSKEMSELAISKNLLVIVVYVMTIFLATIVTLHLYITAFRLEEVMFELISALSNVGLSVGFITPASPVTIKWLFTLLMWLGRLEIVPVVIIAMGMVKGIQEDLAGTSPPGHL